MKVGANLHTHTHTHTHTHSQPFQVTIMRVHVSQLLALANLMSLWRWDMDYWQCTYMYMYIIIITTSMQNCFNTILHCPPQGAHSPALVPRQQGCHFPLPLSPLSWLADCSGVGWYLLYCGKRERKRERLLITIWEIMKEHIHIEGISTCTITQKLTIILVMQ